MQKIKTKICFTDENPIFFETWLFSSERYDLMRVKVELYYLKGNPKKVDRRREYDTKELEFLGDHIFNMDELLRSRTGMIRKPIGNRNDPKLEVKMDSNHDNSKIVLRYEEVEQTNDYINLTLRATEFEEKGAFIFKLYRNRSMGEFF